jgi:hypothetical protein
MFGSLNRIVLGQTIASHHERPHGTSRFFCRCDDMGRTQTGAAMALPVEGDEDPLLRIMQVFTNLSADSTDMPSRS